MHRPAALVVWEARVWILGVALVATAVASVMGARQPKVYEARATILAPKEGERESLAATIGSLLNAGSGGGGGSLSALLGGASNTTTADLFMLLLRSRGLRERVVAAVATEHGPAAERTVVDVVTETPDPGSLSLTVEATDPVLAAEFANEYFVALDRTLELQNERRAEHERSSYAAQLARAAREVSAAERALLKFQNETRLLGNFDTSMGTEIDVLGGMRGAILNAEMRREVAASWITPEHPDLQQLDKEIAALKEMYSRTLYGAPMELHVDGKGRRKEYFVPTAELTSVQLEQMKLFRQLKIQEAFYTAALGGLEQLQYGNTKPPTRVVSVDRAVPSGIPLRPNVPFIVTAAIVSSLITGALLAILVERIYERRIASVAGGRSMPATIRAEA